MKVMKEWMPLLFAQDMSYWKWLMQWNYLPGSFWIYLKKKRGYVFSNPYLCFQVTLYRGVIVSLFRQSIHLGYLQKKTFWHELSGVVLVNESAIYRALARLAARKVILIPKKSLMGYHHKQDSGFSSILSYANLLNNSLIVL